MSNNRQRLAIERLKASGPILCHRLTAKEQADYERRQRAIHDAMTRRIDAANPRNQA